MANSALRLYYLDAMGRAEVARLILTAARKEFEDIRFSYDEWYKTYKSSAPFGQCPMLEVDGEMFAQSLAINTFLAREFGFYGRTNLECLEIDQIVQLVEELLMAVVGAYYVKDEAVKAEMMKKAREVDSVRYLTFLENMLKRCMKGYFVGNRLTLADFVVFDISTGFLQKGQYLNIDYSYPFLLMHRDTVKSHPRIAEYLENRKDTPY